MFESTNNNKETFGNIYFFLDIEGNEIKVGKGQLVPRQLHHGDTSCLSDQFLSQGGYSVFLELRSNKGYSGVTQ